MPSNPTLFRRLAALFYDALLLISLFMIGSLLALCFTHGTPIPPNNPYYQGFLFLITFAFFVGFWCFGGQTGGMRAWRLQLVTAAHGHTPSFFRASVRFILAIMTQACGGIGWFWILVDPEGQTLYDRLTGTRLFYSEKTKGGAGR